MQVDVLFKNVSSVSLPTTLDELEVYDGEGSGLPVVAGPVGGGKVFVIRASGIEGYVLAGAVFHKEYYGTHAALGRSTVQSSGIECEAQGETLLSRGVGAREHSPAAPWVWRALQGE